MPQSLPAISLVAVPGRRRATIELAKEIERRGFSGIYVPSIFSNMSLCEALAWHTDRIAFGTAIAPIYARTVPDFAQAAAFIHEISGGRFRFGVGVAHPPGHARMGVTVGKPIADTRQFVERLQAQTGQGDMPPIILAALRKKMVALSGEISRGVVFANASRSFMAESLRSLPQAALSDPDFFIGDMVPTCISDDVEAAKAVNRRTLTGYALMPNYRNYWKECGYVEEMEAIERAVEEDRLADVPKYLTDAWLADVTLFGTASQVRDQIEAWRDVGMRTPILVPSSAAGNQLRAIEEVFAAFA